MNFVGGITFASLTFSNVFRSVSPLKSISPVSSSYKTMPSEKISDRLSIGLPHACSGDIYAIFPFNTPVLVSDVFDAAFAMPKSTIFTSPS